MFGSQLLEIAIGLVFIFLLFSLICSGANELLTSIVNARGHFLMRGLEELLNDKNAAGGLLRTFYNHGLIYGLYRGEFDPRKSKNLPAYIPSKSFALAIMDILPRLTAPDGQNDAAISGAAGATSWTQVKDLTESSLKSFREAVASYPDSKLREPLLALIDSANGDATRARQNIEDWYNSTMDRVSGWYKSRSQWILFALGLVVAVTFNADTLTMTRQLSNDMVMRQSLVAAAQERARSHTAGEANEDLKQNVTSLNALGLPVGWVDPGPGIDQAKVLPRWSNAQEFLGGCFWLVKTHAAGWLLTAVAVSLGAPFWFDLLNRFMVVRSTVKPQEKSQTEGSKD